jgi:hypothetical protein
MPNDLWIGKVGMGAFVNMKVCAAHAGAANSHQPFAGPGLGFRSLDDDKTSRPYALQSAHWTCLHP